ncbi:MAG: hypothetical protein PHV93_02275 [Candidatus Pacebacteria bacterium]|nr:hypothetical protein [Candidatus Paceibacterota bacterium]
MEKISGYIDKNRKVVGDFLFVVIVSAGGFFFSPKESSVVYDYTFRIAEALTHGRLGLSEHPSWLSELVPFGGQYFSVFPLGSVLTMVPWAVLKNLSIISALPTRPLLAIIALLIGAFSFLICSFYRVSLPRRILLSLFPLFGTWAWANLAFSGAWQLALGFAMVGELGALYFTICRKNPFLAGLFFALAFGNRTEIIATLPIFLYLLWRSSEGVSRKEFFIQGTLFLLVPFILGIATLGYNFVRFSSPFDFGYSRIPGILNEAGYSGSFFSFHAISDNFQEMLIQGWKRISAFPYFIPSGWGGSIFLFCPFLFLLFRKGAKDKIVKWSAWVAILILTFILWLHGNAGGWQVSYRYAMILIPWMLVIFLENGKSKLSWVEIVLFAVSFSISAYTFYIFTWTNLMTL